MPFVTTQRWSRRLARDPAGQRVAHGVDFSKMEISAGQGIPAIGLTAWDVPFSLTLRCDKSKRYKVKQKNKGFTIEGVGSDLSFEEAESLSLPTGEIWTPESGLLKTTLTLDKTPSVNAWAFDLTLPPGVALAYQPLDLAPEEIAWGGFRPDWAKGSFAVFDATACKIAHIPRPFARDADGAWTWCSMGYVGGALVVTVPLGFLDAARYPVQIDPSFGYTSIGLSSGNSSAQGLYVTGTYSPPSNGTTDSISWYCKYNDPAARATMGLYLNSSGNPGARVVDTDEGTPPSTPNWLTRATDSAAQVYSSSVYWVASHHNNVTTGAVNYYDTPVSGAIQIGNATYASGAVPNPAPSLTNYANYQFSGYVNYTPAAGFLPYPYPLHDLCGGIRE